MKKIKIFEEKPVITGDPLIDKILKINGNEGFFRDKEVLSKKYPETFEKAKEILSKAKKVFVLGDYDGDGVTGTAILVKGISTLKEVIWRIPTREEGFGMKKIHIEEAIKQNCDTVITVDNGGKAIEAIEFAKQNGLNVIVTDHHDFDEKMGEIADCFINPHYESWEGYYEEICGAMVAYHLSIFCFNESLSRGEKIELEELAATGTITDVMPLVEDNRTFVKKVIESSKKRKSLMNNGLNALMTVSNDSWETFSSNTIGFSFGPMINACGRLGDASRAVELLLAKTDTQAKEIAKEMKELNQKRKDKTTEVMKIAVEQLQKNNNVEVVVIEQHIENLEGLIGIISGNITEEYGVPSFVFASHNGKYKASGRSPLNFNLIKGATKVLEENTNIKVVSYGGHAGAMGITIADADSLKKFIECIREVYEKTEKEELVEYCVKYPISTEPTEILDRIDPLEPFGQGNKQPLFYVKTYIGWTNTFADKHLSGRLRLFKEKGIVLDFMYFNGVENYNGDGMYEVYFTLNKGSKPVAFIERLVKVDKVDDKNGIQKKEIEIKPEDLPF